MPKIRFAVAQMNPVVGDYAANTKKIIEWIEQAERRGSDLIVFPEMALCGYPVWDLAARESFIREGRKCLSEILSKTKSYKVAVILGLLNERTSEDARSRNSLVCFSAGKILSEQTKRLLPNYDVFLEQIFFQPGKTSSKVKLPKFSAAPLICEDIWDDAYDLKPVQELARQKPDIFVSISASPYYRGVAEAREKIVKRHVASVRRPFLYVNQIGGQDDLIFDGRSFFSDARGRILFRAPGFEEGLYFFDYDEQSTPLELSMPAYAGTPEEVYKGLVLGVRDYCRKNGFSKIVIGLSGGIDSALVAALAVDALGPAAVTGVTMPGPYSSPGSWKDSEILARRLGIEFRVHPIKDKYKALLGAYRAQKRSQGRPVEPESTITLAMENLQARIRGLELMFISNDENRLVLTTGNKSELAMGYCTLYGDMAGGLAVIGDVFKTDVFKLCEYRNKSGEVIPKAILTKAPSAELRPNQKDEDSLPKYEILDEVLYLYIEKNKSAAEISKTLKSKISAPKIAEILRRVDQNEYKRRQTPPILRVTSKAWFGRRMPITNRFKG